MKKSLFVVVTLLLGMGGMALAQQEPAPAPRQGQGVQRRMMIHRGEVGGRLNLTDDQKAQMRKVNADIEKKLIPVQSKIKLARIDLRELMGAEKPDRSAIEKKMKEVSDLQYQVKIINLDRMLTVKGILTPEQLKIWKDRPMGMRGGILERIRGWLGRLGPQRMHRGAVEEAPAPVQE
jgi:Spy/CpxP family protein refolding chaperone